MTELETLAEFMGYECHGDAIPNEYTLPIMVDNDVSFVDRPFKWIRFEPRHSDSQCLGLLDRGIEKGLWADYTLQSDIVYLDDNDGKNVAWSRHDNTPQGRRYAIVECCLEVLNNDN